MSFISTVFGNNNERYIKSLIPLISKIGESENSLVSLTDLELKERREKLKERLTNGEDLDNILVEAFALVREAAKRTLNQRPFDTQMIAGVVLHQGKITEMKTGEGKTLAATMPLFLNALSGNGCYLVTVNDYLAKRDMVWMGQIFNALGLTVSCIVHDASYLYDADYQTQTLPSGVEMSSDQERDKVGGFKVINSYLRPVNRKDAYLADITYGTNSEFGFDYLKDNMVYDLNDQNQRGFNYAIIDEVDSILIDEARTPLIISAPDTESSKWYHEFSRVIPKLIKDEDYEIDEKMRAATLTEVGIDKIEKLMGMENIYEERGMKFLHYMEQSLKAETLFRKDKEYVVKNGEIVIVDDFTGRLLYGRRYSGGLHQAIEAKEGVRVQEESLTLASVTFQNFFRMFSKLAGMTGTATTSAEEFDKVYHLEVVTIPTNKPMIRRDMADKIYKNEAGKFRAVVLEIKARHEKGQPLLVGTTSIEKNETLSQLLSREGVSHQLLNAKNNEKEGEIIAQAGRFGAVTVATNMAGRGVDIILGGNPPDKEDADKVLQAGGLHVIGTERHEARRIDNQLRGRSGRQGDAGSSQFFISMEDELMRRFQGDRLKSMMEKFKIPDDEAIEMKMISNALEDAQAKVEGANFDARKNLLEYDDVMNKHRQTFYGKRREIIESATNGLGLRDKIIAMIEKAGYQKDEYEKKETEVGPDNMRQLDRIVCVRVMDLLWLEHLENMEHLMDSVRLRAYGQKDPLVEYKTEGHQLFQKMMETLEKEIVEAILKFKAQPTVIEKNQTPQGVSIHEKEPGRNDPCPCKATKADGSPVKYKHCHGKNR
ncbi:MAG: preprotein translocase subunit SecA [bacterium]